MGNAGRWRVEILILVAVAIIYFGAVVSPPRLMDDVDAVQAQIARNMLESGDFTTARLDGIAYLEKSPLIYWSMAASFALFGVHDWAARLPVTLAVLGLVWLTMAFGRWAFGFLEGRYAGLCLGTCLGLWLFTRIQIPDVVLTLAIAAALWSFLRLLDPDETNPKRWAVVGGASLGFGLLLKGLIALLFPGGAIFFFLLIRRRLFDVATWKRLHPATITLTMLLIAAPWHIAATLANPPYFDFTWRSAPGEYHGFFWFYFLNEHVFRFLNIRYPRDYNTVPRLAFWLLHLAWLFPWSFSILALPRTAPGAAPRERDTRLLVLCWIGFVLVFFSFSTTQEYYSMPIYPALALLLGLALARGGRPVAWALRASSVLAALSLAAIVFILSQVVSIPAPGDIAQALMQNPDAYTLSLGHMGDLTLKSFAYLKLPLMIAGLGFLAGAAGLFLRRISQRAAALAVMMVLFFQAARLALIAFDPYLGSYDLARSLRQSPPGQLIVDNQYYAFSSVFFYTNRRALLLNGRVNNLEYGSYAPDSPRHIFINDQEFARLWPTNQRYYIMVEAPALPRIQALVPAGTIHVIKASGGKFLVSNQP